MPFAHQFFGVPFLSFVGRVKYGVNIKDFHCGLRGVDKNAVRKLSFHTLGMEFATEIIAVFAKAKLPISQIDFFSSVVYDAADVVLVKSMRQRGIIKRE